MQQQWVNPSECNLGGKRIVQIKSDYSAHSTTAEQIIVLKGEGFFKRYQDLPLSNVRRIIEVGIFEGGSAMLLADMFPEAEIIGIDIRDPNPAVLRHIEELGYSDRIKLHYNVSQGDKARIADIVQAAWGDAPVDLVIDDASHTYDLSIATFDALFPRLRTGGAYVVEDWGWAHWPNFDGGLARMSGRALSSMVLELVMASAGHGDAVAEVLVSGAMATAIKGPRNPPPFAEIVRLNGERSWQGI